MEGVKLSKLIEKLELRHVTADDIDISKIVIKSKEVNRPGLELAGFYNHFTNDRIQFLGNVEQDFLCHKTEEQKKIAIEMLFSRKIPCMILCRGYLPDKYIMDVAIKHGVPLLVSKKPTSELIAATIRFLHYELAPCVSIHAVMVDVYGEGVLITGESGIGKSEIALELIKRGHRLVSDDCVDIKKINADELIGSAPEVTRHFIELRGIGIINAKDLFGYGSVKDSQKIDMKINLTKWTKDTEFDRMGLEDNYDMILDTKVPLYNIPVSPGRNVAIIIECAAMNHRQKMTGVNAAEELQRRVEDRMRRMIAGEEV